MKEVERLKLHDAIKKTGDWWTEKHPEVGLATLAESPSY